ncbi:hypothetical protein ANS017_04230 [Paraclostridium bifermentans]|uniref:DUF2812 domain-containing protein n=1 Tax=Paraclostridium bifermentans TaxID=1490 RepID=UPI0021C30B70|nr:DUF2812 domain-containing protein [Paraclostridium bifermentans]GKZ02680.1 hypothetical protein ANS014_11140 [Paraclostridium bifermentans]GKZ07099.1 hypothetical protein ANS015_19820 [Paraclostridium bifermentans]GKZ09039.1 hypothetical protein ANS017_04230 [Paraclostridium bifermentans]
MNKSKVFFDIEKETKWLNSLAKQGYRLTGKSWFTYSFKPCEKGAYIYQVEKRKPFTSDENLDYLDFVSSLDINTVAIQWGWFYFEKENDGKDFEIFSDIQSKISHYKNLIFTLLIIGFFSFCIFNNCLNSPIGSQGPYIFNISFPLIANPLLMAAVAFTIIKYFIKIHKLKKERFINE